MTDTIVSKLLMPVRSGDTALVAITATADGLEAGRRYQRNGSSAWREGRQYVVEDGVEATFYRTATAASRAFCGANWRTA